MSAISVKSPVKPGANLPPSASPAAPAAVEFRYTQTDGFAALLQQLGASLLISTYQANKLLVARAAGAGLSMLVRTFDRPMGLAVEAQRLTIGARNQIWFLRNASDIAPRVEPAGLHDACYLPRSCHVTGDIGVHELAWAGEELWVVNTRFSCLCTLDPNYSFVPRWRPPFISALAAEDRCHLNGLAIVDGKPKYVTALGVTDTADGWRENKPLGGCLMAVPGGEVISCGLSMPHSPRWHDGRLYVLESGTGRVVLVDPSTGERDMVARLPGFTRGLAMTGPYAFVGLSKIRKTSAMDGVPLSNQREQLKCGVAAVDLRTGQVIALLEFQTAVEEIFDVQLLPGLHFPEVIGFQQETILHTFVVPPADSRWAPTEDELKEEKRPVGYLSPSKVLTGPASLAARGLRAGSDVFIFLRGPLEITMRKMKWKLLVAGAFVISAFGGIAAGIAWATAGQGISTTIIAGPTALGEVHVDSRSDINDVKIKTKGLSDVYVVQNRIVPGGHTGWHSHPGPSIVSVVSGTATEYRSDEPDGVVYAAGTAFVDEGGDHAHIIVNEGNTDLVLVAVQILPFGAPRRIDVPAP